MINQTNADNTKNETPTLSIHGHVNTKSNELMQQDLADYDHHIFRYPYQFFTKSINELTAYLCI